MKFPVGVVGLLLSSSAFALSIKRQNDVPNCVDGNQGEHHGGPYQTGSECAKDCYLIEKGGDRVDQICKGYCKGTPLWTGGVVYNCYGRN